MKTVLDYIIINVQPLSYRGHYAGETDFVDGYERYETIGISMGLSNPINSVWHDWDGNETISTPLKTVIPGESVFSHFNNSIATGRNFQLSDLYAFVIGQTY